MSNIYDIFRSVQEKRKDCYDKRSAAFILDGQMSLNIYHKRLEKTIKASLVFNHKEGPDEVIVYSLLEDDLLKSDYFIYKETNFLIYEENRLTDEDIIYRKQKAVECNVAFSYKEKVYNGYFKSSVRTNEDVDFIGKQILLPDETPLLILPTNSFIDIGSEFMIEDKPFKVLEYDRITNKGITYYYLERNFNKTLPEVDNSEPDEELTIVDETIQLEQEENTDLTLHEMVEYKFSTEDAFFAATPAVEILSRRRNEITFRVPFGISAVSITTRENGVDIENLYKVVL